VIAERLEDLGVTLLVGERVEEHDGTVQFRVDVDPGDRDEREALVVDPHEFVGDDLLQGRAHPRAARVLRCAAATAALSCHRDLLGEDHIAGLTAYVIR
jgi:hypothetical protein